MSDLPPFYFRIRDNGAQVFRVDAENRQRRLELDAIATVNINNGTIKPQGDHILTPEESAVITTWLAERKALLTLREVDDILRCVDHLNLTTHWAQSRATPEQLDAVTDQLLLAMHDLRSVLVRKKAENLAPPAAT